MQMPANEKSSLEGQVAVVTGAGRGIGRGIAQALAANGAVAALLARSPGELADTVSLIQRAGGAAHAFPVDVTDAAKVRTTFVEIEGEVGPIDLLVNNAGVLGPLGPFWENDVEEWWRAMEVNLKGALLCCHAVLPEMISRRRGRIINIASGAGAIPIAFFSAYVANKTALVRFSENLAIEAKPYGVSVFSISPGSVRTALAEESLNSVEGQKWLPWFTQIFEQAKNVPVERGANLVAELASGKADALTGQFLSIADDLDALVTNTGKIDDQGLNALRIRKLGDEKPAYSALLASANKLANKLAKPS
jgi:NAD(P)-dependent dehydrogenase (short-subunit alcohol dehydrogenase family)